MNSRSNSCKKKAKKDTFEAKKIIYYSSLETGCDLCLQRMSYKSAKKLFKKDEAQKLKFTFGNR